MKAFQRIRSRDSTVSATPRGAVLGGTARIFCAHDTETLARMEKKTIELLHLQVEARVGVALQLIVEVDPWDVSDGDWTAFDWDIAAVPESTFEPSGLVVEPILNTLHWGATDAGNRRITGITTGTILAPKNDPWTLGVSIESTAGVFVAAQAVAVVSSDARAEGIWRDQG